MDDLGDILYFLLIIVAAISGIIRSNKKKQAAREAMKNNFTDEDHFSERQQPPKRNLENIFSQFERVLLDEENEPAEEQQEVYVPEKTEKENMVVPSTKTEYQSLLSEFADSREKIISPFKRRTISDKLNESIKENEPGSDETADLIYFPEKYSSRNIYSDLLKDPDDIRKAVVLSEIIKPKYI